MTAVGKARSGTPLTPAYEREPEREAEAGFELATLRSAAASPPAFLYGRAGRSPRLDVRVRRRHVKRSAEVRQKRPRQRPRWAQPVPRR